MNQTSIKDTNQISVNHQEPANEKREEAPKKTYSVIAKNIPGEGVVVSTNHGRYISLSSPDRELFGVLGVREGNVAIVKDLDRDLSFASSIKLLPTRVYISIPKIFWPYYERGERVRILLTILPEVRKIPKPTVIKS